MLLSKESFGKEVGTLRACEHVLSEGKLGESGGDFEGL